MIIKKIKDFTSLEFKEASNIYLSSFPPVETIPLEKIMKMLQNDNYNLFIAKENNSIVGIFLLYIFRDLKIGLLGYMAVVPPYQRKGIGTKMFRYVLDELRRRLDNPVGLLLEIQKEDVDDPEERIKREDRIRFYARHGAKILSNVNYLMPPQHGDNTQEMHLMIVPLARIDSLPKESVHKFIEAIHSRVYQYEKNDLLEKTMKTLPHTIKISEIR